MSQAQASKPNAEAQTPNATPTTDDPQKALTKGLEFLARATRERDDAYALALYVIAAQKAGRLEAARESAKQLLRLAQEEAGALFWEVDDVTQIGRASCRERVEIGEGGVAC